MRRFWLRRRADVKWLRFVRKHLLGNNKNVKKKQISFTVIDQTEISLRPDFISLQESGILFLAKNARTNEKARLIRDRQKLFTTIHVKLRRRNYKHSSAFSTNATSQLDVFGHDGHSLSMDGAQVGIFEEADKVRFGSFLKITRTFKSRTHSQYICIFHPGTLE